MIWVLLGLFALLSLVGANPTLHLSKLLRLTLGIAPFSGVLGFVTPLLIDRWSGGDPGRAGKAYAVNVLGCILGPLLSGFVLLPLISERWVLFVFALPWLFIAIRPQWFSEEAWPGLDPQAIFAYAVVLLALVVVFTQASFEDQFGPGQIGWGAVRRSRVQGIVLRDNTATIVATGEGRDKSADPLQKWLRRVIQEVNDGVVRIGIEPRRHNTRKKNPDISPEHIIDDLRDSRVSGVASYARFRKFEVKSTEELAPPPAPETEKQP